MNKICTTPGCNKPNHAKELCHTCYTRKIRNKKRNVTLRINCKPCNLLDDCPDRVQKGSFKCIEIRRKSVTIRNKSVTSPQQKTPTITPGKRKRNTEAHRFFYLCNYIGDINGIKTDKKGTYKPTYKDFKALLPILNKSLQLYDQDRWNKPAISRAKLKGPKISILFTKKNKTMALGIEHFSWRAIDIPDMGIHITPIEAMENDAYLMAAEIGKYLNITIDNLHMEKLRRLEGHIGRPDKSVKEIQDKGTGNYKDKTTFCPAHFTLSRKGKIQTEREIDNERDEAYMDFFGHPVIEDKEDRTRGPYQGVDLSRYLSTSVVIQNRTLEQIDQYAEALEQHSGFVKEARELITEFRNEVKARRKTDIFLREAHR